MNHQSCAATSFSKTMSVKNLISLELSFLKMKVIGEKNVAIFLARVNSVQINILQSVRITPCYNR